jgi:tRNA(Ile)-lysidine synthase
VVEQFLSHLSSHHTIAKDDRILLAVSGGIDSMVMLDLFKRSHFSIAVAHANFQLRGAASDEDENFVARQCKLHNIPFFSKRFATVAHAGSEGISIQMAARALRYQWFDELVSIEGFQWVATAHHFDDSMETMLMRWLHGAGLEGLAGIPEKNGRIVRPLLFANRKDIHRYAVENSIQWREDSSNQTDDYLRNEIRHKIFPLLREMFPSLGENIRRGQKKALGEISFFEKSFQTWITKSVVEDRGLIRIKKSALSAITNSSVILWRLLKEKGFSFDVCEQIMENVDRQSGKQFITEQYRLIIDRTELIVGPIEEVSGSTWIEEGQHQAILHDRTIKILYGTAAIPVNDPNCAVLDASKLTFPLHWRTWQTGDYFYPLGMQHSKKLSDFLIDAKVPLLEKHSVTVLESDGKIAWVVGWRIDERFKLDQDTKVAISFTLY